MKAETYINLDKDVIMLKSGAIFHLHYGVSFPCVWDNRLRNSMAIYKCLKCGMVGRAKF